MKPLLCGSVVLATCLFVVSCSGDPTSNFQGNPARLVAEPSSLFLDQGSNSDVIVTLEDEQGNPIVGSFVVSDTGAGIAVRRNRDFLETTAGRTFETRAQFTVTAGAVAMPSSFTVTAGGLSLEIPVVVTPTELVATFSNPTPAVNEPVTITAEGFSFLPTAAVSFGGDSVLILGNDGASVTFLPPPGTAGPALVEGVAISFLPTTPLSLLTTTELTVAPLVPLAGTDAPGTAPPITVADVGGTTTFFDGGTYDYPAPLFGGIFGNFPARLYSFTVPADGDFTVTLDWEGGVEDMGVYYFLPDGTTETGSPADAGGAAVHPESSTSTFTAGTYLMAVVNFSLTNPPSISIQFTTEEPSGD